MKIEEFLNVVKTISGKDDVSLDSMFVDLDMDSTLVIESIIEIEILLNIDLLDAAMDLNDFKTVNDLWEYVLRSN